MRVALVIGSGYVKNGQLPPLPSVDVDCELVERRLSDRDAGFRTFRFDASRGLAERIEQRLLARTEPIEELLVYFSGYCVWSAERGPALLLDGERLGTFSVARLRKLLEYFAPSSCVILDVAAVEGAPADVVGAVGGVLTHGTSAIQLLAAARESDRPDSFGGSAFTGYLLMVIDWLGSSRQPDQPVELRWVYDGLRADPALFDAIPAVGLYPGFSRFVILPPLVAADPLELPRFGDTGFDDELADEDDFDDVTPALRRPVFPATATPPHSVDEVAASAPLPSFAEPEPQPGPAAVYDELFESPPVPLIARKPEPPAARPRLPSFAPSAEVGDALFEAGEFERAAKEYDAALALIPDPIARVPLLARQALALLHAGRHADAEQVLAFASALDAGHEDVLAVRAELDAARVPLEASPRPTAQRVSEGFGHERAGVEPAAPEVSSPVDSARGHESFLRYERALLESRDAGEIAVYAERLGELLRAGAGEPARVARALEHWIAVAPQDAAAHERLIDWYSAAGAADRAIEACRRAARLAPARAGVFRRALALFESVGVLDAAWNAACVLECLGEADINESLLASQYKPEGLLAARGSLAHSEWQRALLADHTDPMVWDVLEALGPAGVRVGVGFAKHRNRYVELDPMLGQDPEKSTTTLAKTLGWTARLFGLEPPSLYVLGGVAGGLDVGLTERPSALASRELGSGLGLGELSFLWGRQLPRYRNELRALAFFPTPAELSLLLTAALALGECPHVSVRGLDAGAKRLFAALRREMRGPAFDRLRLAARDFPGSQVGERAVATLRGMELVGVRAGLIACGDVAACAELVQRYPSGALTTPDEQVAELFAFAISEPYASVRRRIGVAVAA